MSSVTKNDFFKSLASYLGICDVIKTTYHTHATFLMGYDVKNNVVYHFSVCIVLSLFTRYTRSGYFC